MAALGGQEIGSAADAERIEAFAEVFHHVPSDRHYQIVGDGEGLAFRRWQLDAAGARITESELPIAWVLGSGNRTRSYLHGNDSGELFMLPIGWYSEDGIREMSPRFEAPDHPGLQRQVQRQCMFCHDACPEVPGASDVHWGEQRFPEVLPQGTGCQRCHGPGAAHVRAAAIRGAIVQPARPEPHRRASVCFQCHLLPSIAVVGARRFGVPDHGYRPGQPLDDYLLHEEVRRDGLDPADDFEIHDHGYRFFRSRCRQESAGTLGCISCHDPHVKPDSASFWAESGAVCGDRHGARRPAPAGPGPRGGHLRRQPRAHAADPRRGPRDHDRSPHRPGPRRRRHARGPARSAEPCSHGDRAAALRGRTGRDHGGGLRCGRRPARRPQRRRCPAAAGGRSAGPARR